MEIKQSWHLSVERDKRHAAFMTGWELGGCRVGGEIIGGSGLGVRGLYFLGLGWELRKEAQGDLSPDEGSDMKKDRLYSAPDMNIW